MQSLPGGSEKNDNDIPTMVVVDINRLHAEYELGKYDQMRDEHWRKQMRIALGISVSGFGILGTIFEMPAAPFFALFFNCIVHVLL